MARGKTKFINLIGVLILVALACVAYFVFKNTNGFKNDFKAEYFEYNGKKIESGQTLVFKETKPSIDLKSIILTNSIEFEVTITANTKPDNDFIYTVDGEMLAFIGLTDLTEYFNVSKSEKSFSLEIPNSMLSLLEHVYPGKEVITPKAYNGSDYFILNIKTDKMTVTSYFNALNKVSEITIDKGEIIF